MELNLDFLKDMKVSDGETGKKGPGAISRIPQKGDILILKNGSIFFTDKLKKFLGENFADFVFLSEWYEAKGASKDQDGLFFVPIPKGSAKASIRDKVDSKLSFIKNNFIPALKEKLYIDVEVLGSVELGIDFSTPITNTNGIYHFEKLVSSGELKGSPTNERRENVELFPMAIIETEVEAKQQEVPFSGTHIPNENEDDNESIVD